MNVKLVLVIVLFVALAVVGLGGWTSLASAQGGTPTVPPTTAAPSGTPGAPSSTGATQGTATANITSPATGATVAGSVPVTGTATGPNFAYYLVQFKLGDQWTLVDETVHTTPVTTTGTLATWNTTQYMTAAFDLRLLVVDKTGQFVTATVSVKVDNSKTPRTVVLPNRGCTACHAQIAPDGRYTLAWEAMNADPKHPALPKGFQTAFADCMLCHAVKGTTGIAGVVAPITMRAIVHPVHMNSEIFASELHGNCFSCHEVDNGGKFTVLPEKVNVGPGGVQVIP